MCRKRSSLFSGTIRIQFEVCRREYSRFRHGKVGGNLQAMDFINEKEERFKAPVAQGD